MRILRRWLPAVLLAAACAAVPALGQDSQDDSHCRHDEIDMGDYCVSLVPPQNEQESGNRRVTPFRAVGMMPGRAGGARTEPPKRDLPRNTLGAAPGRGFGVQLGIFSSRATAEGVVAEAVQGVAGPFALAPLDRGERILWAVIHGPFPDQDAARAARDRLHARTPYDDAWVKPLTDLKLIELPYERIEK